MNLQLLRHGISRPTLRRVAGLAFVLSILGIAQAQVATHTQLTGASGDHGVTYTAKISDIAGNPAADGVVSLENAQGSLGSAFVKNGEATLKLDHSPSGASMLSTAAAKTSRLYGPGASCKRRNQHAARLFDHRESLVSQP